MSEECAKFDITQNLICNLSHIKLNVKKRLYSSFSKANSPLSRKGFRLNDGNRSQAPHPEESVKHKQGLSERLRMRRFSVH